MRETCFRASLRKSASPVSERVLDTDQPLVELPTLDGGSVVLLLSVNQGQTGPIRPQPPTARTLKALGPIVAGWVHWARVS